MDVIPTRFAVDPVYKDLKDRILFRDLPCDLPLSMGLLATMVGTPEPVLSEVVSMLRGEGLIEVDREVGVPDRHARVLRIILPSAKYLVDGYECVSTLVTRSFESRKPVTLPAEIERVANQMLTVERHVRTLWCRSNVDQRQAAIAAAALIRAIGRPPGRVEISFLRNWTGWMQFPHLKEWESNATSRQRLVELGQLYLEHCAGHLDTSGRANAKSCIRTYFVERQNWIQRSAELFDAR